jgi:uncharacterized surface protein with fasciclin (FAS1) repeats
MINGCEEVFKNMRLKIAVLALCLVLVPLMAMAQAPSKDIVDTAVAAGQFKTLASLLEEVNLVETLKSPGPFTVFAPTDAAFAKLPAGTLEKLKKDHELLKKVLFFHVVPGKYLEKDMIELKECRTLCPTTGGVALLNLKVDKGTGKIISVEGAKPIKTDVLASNGVIHIIDEVMITPMRVEK